MLCDCAGLLQLAPSGPPKTLAHALISRAPLWPAPCMITPQLHPLMASGHYFIGGARCRRGAGPASAAALATVAIFVVAAVVVGASPPDGYQYVPVPQCNIYDCGVGGIPEDQCMGS